MPAVYLTKEQERIKKASKFLKKELLNRDIDRVQLSRETSIKYDTLVKRIREPDTIRLSELWKIMDALRTPQEERCEILR